MRPLRPMVTGLETVDVRFPTSRTLDGSDAMNPDPDYSAAYVIVHTDTDVDGHGFAFTIGRGTEVQVAAIEALEPLIAGLAIDDVLADMGGFARMLGGDSQLRWLGPEKGVIHMATAAVTNAMWDLFAKREGKPPWKLLADMEPEELVALVDFRYITDALTPDEALALLHARRATRHEREDRLLREGYPSYTTSAGLGYDDERLRRGVAAALDAGFAHVKVKVGGDLDDDVRRLVIAREVMGPGPRLMIDANQRWDVGEAEAWIARLAPFDLWWVEEPTSPDDILGHARLAAAFPGIAIATGEHVHNRVMFKQLLQTGAIGVCQIDACRLGGVNEVIAVLLMAAKFGVPVCPHAGGVGLCELVQHLAAFDFVAVSGTMENRVIEYVDHLHEHFVDPCVVRDGRYRAPLAPGFSAQMFDDSLPRHAFPHGEVWAGEVVA